jgi:hypothetical protein
MSLCILAHKLLEELSKNEFTMPELEDKVKDNIELYRTQLEGEA